MERFFVKFAGYFKCWHLCANWLVISRTPTMIFKWIRFGFQLHPYSYSGDVLSWCDKLHVFHLKSYKYLYNFLSVLKARYEKYLHLNIFIVIFHNFNVMCECVFLHIPIVCSFNSKRQMSSLCPLYVDSSKVAPNSKWHLWKHSVCVYWISIMIYKLLKLACMVYITISRKIIFHYIFLSFFKHEKNLFENFHSCDFQVNLTKNEFNIHYFALSQLINHVVHHCFYFFIFVKNFLRE